MATNRRLKNSALLALAGILFCLFLLGAPASWAEEETPQIKIAVVPVFSGYPTGEEIPLPVALGLPKGLTLPLNAPAGSLVYSVDNDDKFKITAVELGPVPEGASTREGMILIQFKLVVSDNVEPGVTNMVGKLMLPTNEKGAVPVGFSLPINVLAKDEAQRVINPRMLGAILQHLKLSLLGDAQAEMVAPEPAEEEAEADPYAGSSFWWILLLIFGGGLALNLTPCVYPMIPITVSFFGGRAQGGKSGMLLHSVVYLLGLAVTYSVLGSFVSLSGRMLGDALTSPWVTSVAVLILLIMASSMFGFWEIKMPASMNRLAAADRAGVFGTLIMGLTVGILCAPCVGPFVVGLMTHVAQVGQVGYGLLLFFVLSLGLGLPLAVLAFFSGFISRLPRAGDWMVWVRKFFGVVLVLMAVTVAKPLLEDRTYAIIMLAVAFVGALYLGLIEKSGRGGFKLVKRIAALVLLVAVGAYFWWTMPGLGPSEDGAIAWQKFSPQLMEQAAKDGKPVMVDFSADWCAPCRRMEAETFPDKRVVEKLANFVALKADVTKGASEEMKPYVASWVIRGVPSLIFLDSKGEIMRDMTVVGFMGPDDLSQHLAIVLKKAAE